MLRAVLFDFNGVIIDDEPIHFRFFQKVLGEVGIPLSEQDYYEKYLGFDDQGCFSAAARDQGQRVDEVKIQEWIDQKAKLYLEALEKAPPFVPGVVDFIRDLAKTHYLAVVSGALRQEIEMALSVAGLNEEISVIVAAGETTHGKPQPDGFLKAMDDLNRDFIPTHDMLFPRECLVIEDSTWGIQAATTAEMPCVAVTTSFKKEELPGAIEYFKDFQGLKSGEFLEKLAQSIEKSGV